MNNKQTDKRTNNTNKQYKSLPKMQVGGLRQARAEAGEYSVGGGSIVGSSI